MLSFLFRSKAPYVALQDKKDEVDPRAKALNDANALLADAFNSYDASLPMMIYGELGYDDEEKLQGLRAAVMEVARYSESNKNPAWMQNDSFKAWMNGRVLWTSKALKEGNVEGGPQLNITPKFLGEMESSLETLFNNWKKKELGENKLQFLAWAIAYFVIFQAKDKKTYTKWQPKMEEIAQAITNQYILSGKKQAGLSDVLWTWGMYLVAAAYEGNKPAYTNAKSQIAILGGNRPVPYVIERGLSHTKSSNDYPAWFFAMLQLAAVAIGDQTFFEALQQPTEKAIAKAAALSAKTKSAKAEYALAVLETQRAQATAPALWKKKENAVQPSALKANL